MDKIQERNYSIFSERKQGFTYANLSCKYNLSKAVIVRICRKENKKISLATNPVFSALQAVSDNEALVLRTYNCLNRAGIKSRESLTNLTEHEYRKFRGVGEYSADLISKAIKYCEQ